MMPTFPRSPLSFRTAGFPQYGWKAGLSGGAFPDRQRLKPAPGIRLLTAGLPSPFVHLRVGAVAPYCAGPLTMMMHRPGGWVALRPRGPRSGPGYAVPVRPRLTGPIRPTRRHIATSPQGGLYAMPSLCGSAEATREWFRAFTTIPSRHAVLSDPGEFAHRMCPVARCRRGPSPRSERLGTPNNPAIRFTRDPVFEASLVRSGYGLSGCSPPAALTKRLDQARDRVSRRGSTRV